MEKSIEQIWKEGFLKSHDLVIPKLNDLYNQKSISLIDKMIQMFKINLWGIIAFAQVALIGLSILGLPLVGVLIDVMFLVVAYFSYRHWKGLKSLDTTKSNYEYLVSFNRWRLDAIAFFGSLYRFFYPLFFLAFYLGVWFSDAGPIIEAGILRVFPNMPIILGIPALVLAVIGLGTALIIIFTPAIYRLDINIVYGRLFNRLEEMIGEMEQLRA